MSNKTPTRPTLTLDVALYDHYLENSDLSETEKQEFLQMMWNLIVEFIAFGFEVTDKDVQNPIITPELTAMTSINMVKSEMKKEDI